MNLNIGGLFILLSFLALFVDLTSSSLSTIVQETTLPVDFPTIPDNVGGALFVRSIELEGRIAQNQMILKIDAIVESTTEKFSSVEATSFSTKVEKSMSQLPLAFLVTTANTLTGVKDCTVYGWDTGESVHFYQRCVEGDTYNETYSLTMTFEETDYEGCNQCQDDICFGRPCSNCTDNCRSAYMKVSSWIETRNETMGGREVSEEEWARMTEVERQDAGVTSDKADIISQDCTGMGTGPGRLLGVVPDSNGIKYVFTPSTETTSNPPIDMSLVCILQVNIWGGGPPQVVTTKIRDYLGSPGAMSAVVIPFMDYREEYKAYFLVYCSLTDSTDASSPGQKWQVRLFVSPDDGIGCPLSVEFTGMASCPDNADVDLRKLDDNTWEVAVVNIFGANQNFTLLSILLHTDTCTSEIYEVYKFILSDDTKGIFFSGDVTSFGEFANVRFPAESTSRKRQGEAATGKVTLLVKVKNPEHSWISMLTWTDWKTSTTVDKLGQVTYDSNYVTSFPNNNIQVTQGVTEDIQAYFLAGGVWLAWEDQNSVVGSTTIYSCPAGQQFVTIIDSVSGNTTVRGCFDCPPGQYKNSSQLGENCQLCPVNTFSNVSGSTNVNQCKPCTGSEYCPAGMNTQSKAQSFGQTTFSCTNPWFLATDEVDLEGGFYINQGILIFILSMISGAIALFMMFGHPNGQTWVASFGVWMWDMDDTEEEGKKKLFGIAAFAGATAYLLLVIFILYTLIGANTFIGSQIDVENSVKSNFPDEYQTLTTDPIYFSLTFFGEVARCDEGIISATSIGFYDPDTGLLLLPKKEIGPVPGSKNSSSGAVTECQLVMEIPRSLSSLTPQIQVSYDPATTSSYINRVEIHASTGIKDNGELKSCTQDETVTNKDDLNSVCDNPGYGYASVQLTASQNRALRGSADVTIVKTLGVVQNCKNSYNTYPWSFVQTQTNCEWCNSSTTLLFPSVVKSSLLESTFYYERDPALNFTITLTEGNFARTASISRYFSIGSALLTILITGGGILDVFVLFLTVGSLFYTWVMLPMMGGGGAGGDKP